MNVFQILIGMSFGTCAIFSFERKYLLSICYGCCIDCMSAPLTAKEIRKLSFLFISWRTIHIVMSSTVKKVCLKIPTTCDTWLLPRPTQGVDQAMFTMLVETFTGKIQVTCIACFSGEGGFLVSVAVSGIQCSVQCCQTLCLFPQLHERGHC